MSKLPPVRYTSLTSNSIQQEMVSAIPSLTSRWTDWNTSDVGITILELLSWSLDKLLFYLDTRANESYLMRARELGSVLSHAKTIGYKPHGTISSTTTALFSLEVPASSRIYIPKFTRLRVEGDPEMEFATTEAVLIPTGSSSVEIAVRQGKLRNEHTKTTGEPSTRWRLSYSQIDQLSVEVVIDGVRWTRVESFVSSQASDRHFVIEMRENEDLEVVLGDGFFGYSPPESVNDNVSFRYLTSLGEDGNVGSGTINTILDDIVDALGESPPLSVTNPEPAIGGSFRETVDHIRKQAPAELFALFRAMTKQDYVALAEGANGVAKASAYGEQETGTTYEMMNWVLVVIAPDGVTREALLEDPILNGQPSSALRKNVLQYLHDRAPITTRIKILTPNYIGIRISVTVYHIAGYSSLDTKARIEEEILTVLDFENVQFGKDLQLSNFIRTVDSVTGVSHSKFSLFTSQQTSMVEDTITIGYFDIPYLYSLEITMEKDNVTPPVPDKYPCPPNPPAPLE